MDNEEIDNIDSTTYNSSSAVNNSIINYYKKFGKKRDIEQFFSLSTAQTELKDPGSLFWRRMKAQNESSDSGDKKSESSTELCRVSIRCSVPEPSSSQGSNKKPSSDTESPPIMNEENVHRSYNNSEDEINKSDDGNSRKSVEATLDSSTNRPHSPTSSITSQRKLEWDSLADVGYANESDRKNSASSLSTLERLALQQQYSYSDTKQNSDIGGPTAHSTPVEQNESKLKSTREIPRKTTKIYNKDVDFMEVTVPQFFDNKLQPINLNLTKHISFNVERDGEIKIDNISKNISLSPEKPSGVFEESTQDKLDKEIQTTLPKKHTKDSNSMHLPKNSHYKQKFPVLISLNTLKKRNRRKKVRKFTRQSKMTLVSDKKNAPEEKSGDPLSDAESFEYMPGHMYNQSQIKSNLPAMNIADNKSSLESSAGHTTESSKESLHSFTKDLEKSIDLLKTALQHRYEDSNLKKKLIKEVVQRLMKSRYRDDDNTTDFLSGLDFNKIQYNQTTSSTSDNNINQEKTKVAKPRKSILRSDNTFCPNPMAETSQSAPNIPSITNIDKPLKSNLTKLINISSTDSDNPRQGKKISDIKTSSEELYKQYLEALKKEDEYKKHLKSKEIFLRQKLGSSEAILNVVKQNEIRSQNRLKNLMNDLSRNNYDDGSGDASKLEYGSSSNIDLDNYSIKKHRSHSVFTLSSGNTEAQSKNTKIRDRLQNEIHNSLTENNKTKKCCCSSKAGHKKVSVTDSSIQVNLKSGISSFDQISKGHNIPEVPQNCSENKSFKKDTHQKSETTEDIKYVCLCADNAVSSQNLPQNILIYKCSRLPNKCFMIGNNLSEVSSSKVQYTSDKGFLPDNKLPASNGYNCDDKCLIIKDSSSNTPSSKSSQTNLNLPLLLHSKSSDRSVATNSEHNNFQKENATFKQNETSKNVKYIQEATRWIQTEISIDPKISDPSLTDIKIIGDENSVKLVSLQYKEVSQPSSDNNVNNRLEVHDTYSGKSDATRPSSNKEKVNATLLNLQDKEVQSCCNESRNNVASQTIHKTEGCSYESDILTHQKEIISRFDGLNTKSPSPTLYKQNSDNFTIPIQGTNMTLKVSLGAKEKPRSYSTVAADSNVKNITFSSKAVETVKSDVVENFTSLQEECSKCLQSDNVDIITQFDRKINPTSVDCDMNTEEIDIHKSKGKTSNFSSQSYNINPCVTNYKRNTYPKPNNTQKPLLRSNTDTGGMEKFDYLTFSKKDADTQYDNFQTSDTINTLQKMAKGISIDPSISNTSNINKCCSTGDTDTSNQIKIGTESNKQIKLTKNNSESDFCAKATAKDPLLEMIQDITKKYSKKDTEKSKRKKCFKEIITVLNYLLDTEDNTENDRNILSSSSTSEEAVNIANFSRSKQCCDKVPEKTFEDKSVQLSARKTKCNRTCTESSDLPVSTDIPSTSDSATCKVLNKIKKECEKYHQKRCKSHSGIKKCEPSSSTSVNCDQCKRVHYCLCRSHRCKNHKSKSNEKTKKKCVAYNLIIQTSDSFMSEEVNEEKCTQQLKNIIVKVPSKRKVEKLQFKEMVSKLEKCNPSCGRTCRSKSLPNDSEISSTDDFIKKAQMYTVREYLEQNRPDFVDNSSKRQNCLKLINETRPTDFDNPRLKMVVVHTPNCMGNNNVGSCNMYCGGIPKNTCNQGVDNNNMHCIQSEVTRIGECTKEANERAAKRQLLLLQLDRQPTVDSFSETELRRLAEHFGKKIRTKKVAPKFISEKEMKQHSEKIYKTLPEVQRKKEEIKKENIKKTNLLMANIFKKNLQKKTLDGAVNLSNYSAVIKI